MARATAGDLTSLILALPGHRLRVSGSSFFLHMQSPFPLNAVESAIESNHGFVTSGLFSISTLLHVFFMLYRA